MQIVPSQMGKPRKHALIVDDDRELLETTCQGLRLSGINCDQATNIEEALGLLHSHQYDVVVTDLVLPRENGHQFCVNILQMPRRPKVIVVTGLVNARIERDLKARGVDLICHKPCAFTELAEQIHELCPTSTAQDDTPASDAIDAGIASGEKKSSAGNPNSGFSRVDESHQSQRKLLLYSLPEPLVSRLANDLSRQGWQVALVESIEDLSRQIREKHVEVLVIPENTTGFFSGSEIIDRVFRQVVPPEIVLLTDHGEVAKPIKFAIHQVDEPLESIDPAALAKTICQIIANLPKRSDLIIPNARRVVELAKELPPLPQLLTKFLEYLELDAVDIPFDELVRYLSFDPRCTAEIMRLANSSMIGSRHQIVDLRHAVQLIGVKRCIGMLLGLTVNLVQHGLLKEWPPNTKQWFHRRMVIISSVASAASIARRMKPQQDLSFVYGLLQDIGIAVMGNAYRRDYLSLLNDVNRVGHLSLVKLERQAYGLTHAEVSAALLEHWGMPTGWIRVISNHHGEFSMGDSSMERDEPQLVDRLRLAEAVADLMSVPHPIRRNAVNVMLNRYSTNDAAVVKEMMNHAVTSIMEVSSLLSLPEPSQMMLKQGLAKLSREIAPNFSVN